MMEFDEIEQFIYMGVRAGIDVDAALFRSPYADEAVCLLGEKDVRRIRIDWRGIVCDALGHGITEGTASESNTHATLRILLEDF